ncbi:winged helix-turn-helix domain-containing protein [Streptomyces sp. NPDC046942]|uniref:response regulator transcription factor n=1 Tax=Streptomyces sp. NPDC046942 TaxID=3155137 RepID=UPI0033DA89A8
MRVLLLEGDETLADALRAHGYEADHGSGPEDGHDVIIVGPASLPACRTLRSRTTTPLIALVRTERDRVTALELSADDYVDEPHEASRIIDRIRATVRLPLPDPPEVPLDMDELNLSEPERTLLAHLLAHPDRVLTRAQLACLPGLTDSLLDAHVTALRAELPETIALEQVRGIGFRLLLSR